MRTIEGNHSLAPALERHNVRESAFDSDGGDERRAPCVRVLDGVSPGERLVCVVKVDDFPVRAVPLVLPEPRPRRRYDELAYLLLRHGLALLCGLFYRVADFLRLRPEIERDNDRVDRHKLLARLPGNGEGREYPGEQERDEALYAQESAEPLYDDFFHFATSFSNLVLLPCRM